MKFHLMFPLVLFIGSATALAQERIYRCGNEYTNTVTESQMQNCKLISGGTVTVIPARKPTVNKSAAGDKPANAANPGAHVDPNDQKSKDSDARLILESELKKAEARRTELQKEYNNGQPEKLGGETRNNQKYLDRVAEMKAALDRLESDIAGIQRELGRLPTLGSR